MKILFILLFLPIFTFSQVTQTAHVSATIVEPVYIGSDSLNHLIFDFNTNYDMVIISECDSTYIPFSINKDIYLKEDSKSINIIYN